MTPLLVALLVAALLIGPLLVLRPRRAALPALPAQWRERVAAYLPPLALLSAQQRAVHARRVEEFLIRVRFIGCDGLALTDEMRITIAGYACLLILRPGAEVFPALRSVLVYPEAFLVPVEQPDALGLVDDAPQQRIGESWQGDRVILSWDDVLAARAGAEHNVVLHEFAHQLDDETPDFPGAPALRDYTRWSEVMQREYERLRRHRRPPVLDPYGAEGPAEFFAVVTEAFVQRGSELRRHHADLYALLRDYYGFETAPALARPADAGSAQAQS